MRAVGLVPDEARLRPSGPTRGKSRIDAVGSGDWAAMVCAERSCVGLFDWIRRRLDGSPQAAEDEGGDRFAGGDAPLNQDVFASLVRRKLASQLDGLEATIDPANFAIRLPSGTIVHLHNAYREYERAEPEKRGAVLDHFVAAFVAEQAVPETLAEAQPHLMPLVRHRYNVAAAQLSQRLRDPTALVVPSRNLAAHLAAGVAFDTPTTVIQLGGPQLASWDILFDEAIEIAIDNLRAKSQEPWLLLEEGVWCSPWRDHYDPSRLLLPELIRDLPVAGEHVVLAPTRMVVLVAGSEDVAALEKMLEIAKAAEQEDRPLSMIPVVLRGDQFVAWGPAEELAAPIGYSEARVVEQAGIYNDQQVWLEDALSEDVLVGTVTGVRRDDGSAFHYSTWTESMPTLLPETDAVALVRDLTGPSLARRTNEARPTDAASETGDETVRAANTVASSTDGLHSAGESSAQLGEVRMVSFEQVRIALGDRLRAEEGLYPRRYRVTSRDFPVELYESAADTEVPSDA